MKKLGSVRQLMRFMMELINLYGNLPLILLLILKRFNNALKANYCYLLTANTTNSYQLARKKLLLNGKNV